MAPLSKVILLDNIEYENNEDNVSGPHSMLFGVKEKSLSTRNSQENVSSEESGKRRYSGEDSPANKVLIRSGTYESLKGRTPKSASKLSDTKIFRRSGTYDISDKENSSNSSYVINQKLAGADNLSYLNENNFPDIVNSTRICGLNFDTSFENASDNSFESDTNATIIYKTLGKSDIETQNETLAENVPEIIARNDLRTCSEESKRPLIKNTISAYGHNTTSVINSTINEINELSGIKESAHSVGRNNDSIGISFSQAQLCYSTPFKTPTLNIEHSPQRRTRPTPTSFCTAIDEISSKRDSLEFEESLGILTPEQMVDGITFAASRTPSSENIGSLPEDLQNLIAKFQFDKKSPLDLPSPNLVDASAKDISLGLIDDRMLSNFTLISDTTMNLELPLDSVDNRSHNYAITRLEQTPSPEDLPLDPAPLTELECKTEPSKSKTASSFINSIASITSLDTGYQGDGEMSRPGSRGPDHSPLTRRPLIRPQARRPEPMTDSDFYTESDVDIPEEHPIRGDRKARVIDGTLYGLDAQTAADIYVNNRENMDSSGIFTDIEGNTLSSADNDNPDGSPSPSDASSKTISNDSQNHAHVVQNTSINIGSQSISEINRNNELSGKRKSIPSSVASSPASVRSPKHNNKEDNSAKKYKMPKRNVASKVTAALESANLNNSNREANRLPTKKTPGRWDAVMNKISKTQVDKSSLKEVKSKLFCNPLNNSNQQNQPQKIQNTRLRRPRPRGEISTAKNNAVGSLNSSASDLSAASPVKRMGSTKKRSDVVRVTQVLTAAQLSPRSVHKNVLAENKKNVATTVTANESKLVAKKNSFVTREKKPITNAAVGTKDCGRAMVKGGRVSPGTRPPPQNRVPVVPLPKTIEALTVLLQHLVFNLDAFQTPYLKKQLEKHKLAAEKAQLAYKQLEETFELFRIDRQQALEKEREQYQDNISEIVNQHRSDIAELSKQHSESTNLLVAERLKLEQEQANQLMRLKTEFSKLQNSHEQALEILREENDSIREEIDEKNNLIKKLETLRKESEKLTKDYETKEFKYKEQITMFTDEIERLKEDNARIMNYTLDGKENQSVIAEVESLRAVLELKQNETSDLRKALVQANQKADLLPGVTEKVSILTARCEDLQSQLDCKTSYESQLITENKKLQQSLKEEFNHSKRLIHHNEELQWKLYQNKEVVNRVLEQAEETVLSRSLATSSFNVRHSTPKQIERASSFREPSTSNKSYMNADSSNHSRKSKNSCDFDSEDPSPPNSPKVKGVVEKSDSVSYVLEMEESPEIIANRLVRRSFRNPTPPKNTPMKSPVNKRARIKVTPISLSASASSIISPITNVDERTRIRSLSVQNSDNEVSSSHSDEVFWYHVPSSTPFHSYPYHNEKVNTGGAYLTSQTHNIDLDYNDDIKLPTLPSEIGRNDAESLPVPQHLARDVMITESNSEDESTASSSSGHL